MAVKLMVKAQSKPAKPSSVIVCLVPPEEVAHQLALTGGLSEGELHVTLAALGKLQDLKPEVLIKAERAMKLHLRKWGNLRGEFSGVGRFTTPAKDVFYASLDAPRLNQLREQICDLLKMNGVPVDQTHGFTPHMTLRYLNPTEKQPIPRLPAVPVVFEGVELWVGPEHRKIPFGG